MPPAGPDSAPKAKADRGASRPATSRPSRKARAQRDLEDKREALRQKIEETQATGWRKVYLVLFSEEIINYDLLRRDEYQSLERPASRFLLDEVLVRVTFGTDRELAQSLCTRAAGQAVSEIVGDVDQEPFTRTVFVPQGVLIRVRYKTKSSKRQEVSSRVTELIWRAFRENADHVQFRLPTSGAAIAGKPADAPPR